MVSRARSKLQRLLKDLDLEDSTSALPEGGTSFLGLSPSLHEEGEGASDNASEFDAPSTSSTYSSDLPPSPRRGGPARHQAALALAASERHAAMERRAMQLMHDYKALQAKHRAHVDQSELEMAQLRSQLATVVQEMEARQREVEARAPAVRARLEDYKDRLQDLRVSEAQYQELLAMPADGLHIVDHVKIAMYEQTRELSREAEHLRVALATSREASGRMEGDLARARAEAARMAATLTEKDKEQQQMMDSFQARVSRLSSELEQALIRAELNSAKGQMYDELRAKTERLELENQRLSVVEATFRRSEQQAAEAAKAHRERDHAFEMLQMDKAYLSKQVEFMAEQQRKTVGELEMREQQVQELQRVRHELYEKLVAGEHNRGRQDEQRLTRELEKLQASTHADLERIRLETTETYEREARLLRELRDQAVDEASRLRVAHAELKDHLEKARSVTAEVQRQLESQVVELQAELRQKAFELGHLRVVLGEKEQLLTQATLQVDLMQEKMQVMRERCQTLEGDLLAVGALPPKAMAPAGMRQIVVAEAADDVRGQRDNNEGGGEAGPGSSSVHAAALEALRKERGLLQGQVATLTAALQGAKADLALVGQPHAFLLEQLAAAKAAADEAWRNCAAAQAAALERERAAADAAAERDALKRDLDTLLVQRESLDRMKQVVMRAVGVGGTAGVTGGGGPALGGQPALVLQGLGAAGTTTIVGE